MPTQEEKEREREAKIEERKKKEKIDRGQRVDRLAEGEGNST